MQITTHHDEGAFTALRAEWNAALHASHADTVFSTWEWQTTWWSHLGRGDLRVGAVRAADGTLIGLFPCFLQTEGVGAGTLRLIGCTEVADYLDLIAPRGQELAVYAAFLEWLQGPDGAGWERVDLCNVPAGSPTCSVLPDLARQAGLRVEISHEDVCPVIELPTDWEAYLATLDKKQRHEIRRKQRRAEAETRLEWYVVGAGRDLRAEAALFLDLHRKSRPDKADFMTPAMEGFFIGLAETMQQAGWLQLMTLTMDGLPAASLYAFDYAGRILLYNSGYDPAVFPQLSAGNVLIAQSVQYAITLGRRVYDFLQGDEEYKYRFGARDTQVNRVVIERGA